MKIFILLNVLISSFCLTSKYYEECTGNTTFAPASANQCRQYDANGAFCCYLNYEILKTQNVVVLPTFFFKKDKPRSLSEPKSYCFGITKEGFDNIKKVIDELKEESGMEKINIDCGTKRLKYYLLNILIIILAVL